MKITLINHSDTLGGASVVTFRLMEALRREGVDARMLVAHKSSDSPFVVQAAPRWRTAIPFLAEHLRIFACNGFSRENLFKASIATDGLPLSRHPLVTEADGVILNWVNQGMLSLDEIGRIADMKPTLWTMHDMWNMTGICHHAGSCEKFRAHCRDCMLLGKFCGSKDLSYRCFNRKRRLYCSKKIKFVSVSSWLTERASQSALMVGQSVQTIPVAFPVDKYSAGPSMSRSQLGLPEGKKLVVMCAARLDDPIKGLPTAIKALNMVKGDFAAVFIGALRDHAAIEPLRIPHVELGPVDDATVRSVMSHASVVISSSAFESFGATLLEGQAAGATPVAFTHDGRSDIISDGISGYSAGHDPTRADSLANAIDKALANPISRGQLLKAAARFSYPAVAREYIKAFSAL